MCSSSRIWAGAHPLIIRSWMQKKVKYSGDSRPYTKIRTDIDAYFPLSQSQSLNIGGFMGTSTQEIPIFKKFRVGGAQDLPGR